ncbi:MAG: hypothetical protein K6G64_02175 [Eubacterium sp.]|nr:hypothetical protein [Eubacterium sp.]
MFVNAEIRDRKKMNREGEKLFIPIVVIGTALIGAVLVIAFGRLLREALDVRVGVIFIFVGAVTLGVSVIIFIPLLVHLLKRANKVYENSWMTRSFDFFAKDRHIYYENRRMHVNVCSDRKEKVIYIHDMGDYKSPYLALFYATITGEDAERFYEYLQENDVVIEKEELPEESGKYGGLAPLKISQYRRR